MAKFNKEFTWADVEIERRYALSKENYMIQMKLITYSMREAEACPIPQQMNQRKFWLEEANFKTPA